MKESETFLVFFVSLCPKEETLYKELEGLL